MEFSSLLQHSTLQVPVSEDIQRFIASAPSLCKAVRASGLVSLNYIKTGIFSILDVLSFRHKTFNLDKHDRLKIGNGLAVLRKDRLVTTDPLREKHWVTCLVVDRLVAAMFRDALDNGTHSWDKVIARALGIVLQSATVSRSGDVALSPHYSTEYLKFEDFHVILDTDEDGKDQFVGQIELKYCKGRKADGSKNKTIRINTLEPSAKNLICPMKLFLALAMRKSAVNSTTFKDLVANTRRRGDKKVIWTQPTWPVLCAFRNSMTHNVLDVGKPVINGQLNKSLRFAAECAGLYEGISTQDVRRGSARDLAYLPTSAVPLGIANDLTVLEMGHTDKSRRQGVTQAYVGTRRDETWAKRLAVEDVKDPFHSLSYAPQPYKKRRLKQEEISAALVDIPKPTANDRIKAATKIHKFKKAEWVTRNREGSNSLAAEENTVAKNAPVTPLPTYGMKKRKVGDALATEEKVVGNIDHSFLARIDPAILPADKDVDEQELELDQTVQDLHQALSGQGANDNLLDNLVDAEQDPSSSVGTLPIDTADFVNFIAKINVYKSRLTPKELVQQAAKGGSRDKPSFFIMSCPNANIGCTFTTHAADQMTEHVVRCSDDPSVHASRQQARSTKCTVEGCNKSFVNKYYLDTHIASIHHGKKVWRNRPCNEQGCDPDVVYETKSQLEKHRELVHEGFPRRCVVIDCSHPNMFVTHVGLKSHLLIAHSLKGENLQAMMTYKTKPAPLENWAARKCPVQRCLHTTTFVTYCGLMAHIGKYHGTEEGIVVEKPHYVEDMAPQKCIIDHCAHPATFVKLDSLLWHIKNKHAMPRQKAKELLALHGIKKS